MDVVPVPASRSVFSNSGRRVVLPNLPWYVQNNFISVQADCTPHHTTPHHPSPVCNAFFGESTFTAPDYISLTLPLDRSNPNSHRIVAYIHTFPQRPPHRVHARLQLPSSPHTQYQAKGGRKKEVSDKERLIKVKQLKETEIANVADIAKQIHKMERLLREEAQVNIDFMLECSNTETLVQARI